MKRRTFLILIALCVVVLSACLLFACSNKSEQQTINNTDETASQTTYTIHFNLNGGRSNSNIRTKQVTRLSANDFFFNVEKSGYIFRGWSYNGRIVFDENGDFVNWVNITDGMTFVAEWDNKAKLDISTNMPEAGTVTKNGKYDFYSYVDVSATVNQGYVFVGWYNEDGIPLSNQLTYRYQMGNKDIELLAIYKLDHFTLHIESNNGYKGTVTINPPNKSGATITYYEDTDESIEYKESVTIAAYTKTDSRFLGWFDAAGRLVSADAVYSFKMPNHYYYLMAKWDYFTITYDLDGGTNNENNPTSYTLSTPTIHLEDPTKGQEYFVGWKLGNKYVSEIDTKMKENITLTAIWQSYTLTTDTNLEGAGTYTGSRTILPGNSATITAETNPGYTWLGWYDGDTLLTTELSYTFTMQNDSVEYTAKWTYYTVSTETNFDGAGTYTLYNDTKVTAGSTVTLTAETNPGYTWIGWYDGDTLLTDKLSYTFTMPLNNVAYIAKWMYYTVSTETNLDGAGTYTICNDAKVTVGSTVTLTAETNPGYTWIGWYDGNIKVCDSLSYTFTMPSANKIYFAKWSKVTLDINNTFAGTINTLNDKYVAGEEVIVTATTNIGYTWLGWYDGNIKVCDSLSYTFAMPTENKTYTAKWTVAEEMSNFNFTSTTTTCQIVSIKDKTVAEIIVPDYVTSIGDSAFSGCSSLESITIPFVGGQAGKTSNDTYQYPFGYIFGTSSYTGGRAVSQTYYGSSTSYTTTTTYYIPSTLHNVTVTGGNILSGAFYNFYGLRTVTIGNSVTSIGRYAFYKCTGLMFVTFSKNSQLTSIGSEAFYGCTGLTSITIPDCVTSIGGRAFNGCSSLESITIPFVGAEAGQTSSYTYQFPFGYIFGTSSYTGGTAVSQTYYGSSTSSTTTTAYYIPSTLRSVTVTGGNILRGAFYNCSMLTDVTIGNSVTSIGLDAFSGCSGLTSITIGDSLTRIDTGAFYGCSNLSTINYTGDVAGWCSISGLVSLMNYGSSTKSLYFDGNLVEDLIIPNGVTTIPYYAFNKCSGLTSITIPDSVTSIENMAFSGCTGLTSVSIPNSIDYISSSAFNGCSEDLYDIYDNAKYMGNTGNPYLVLVKSVNSTITSCTIHNDCKIIMSGAFNLCKNISSIIIPNSVTFIGEQAFRGCTSLTSVTIGNSVTSIGEQAFNSCSGLTSVTIPVSVTSIGEDAFIGCKGLNAIYYAGTFANWIVINGIGNLMKVGNAYKSVYINGEELEGDIVLPEGIDAIPDYAFYYREHVASITIPSSVTRINNAACIGCSELTSITFEGTKAQWNAISITTNWNQETGNYTVHCTDGDVAKYVL